jgi:hypothetical protein
MMSIEQIAVHGLRRCRYQIELGSLIAAPAVRNAHGGQGTPRACALSTESTSVADGADWLLEVKYDGYRLRFATATASA